MGHNLPLIRYDVINRCLRDHDRVYHWWDLAQACQDKIFELTGRKINVSRRTIMYDISNMRSGRLGYEAPIVYSRKEGYRYDPPDFSIYKVPFNKNILRELAEAMGMLGHFVRSNKLFSLEKMLKIVENEMNIRLGQIKRRILLEESTNVLGQANIDAVYQAIKEKKALWLDYLPFNREQEQLVISPYYIKEYNNRWFVLAYDHNADRLITPSLDRIVGIRPSLQSYAEDKMPDPDEYFRHIYGITNYADKPVEHIVFTTTPLLARYIETKPIHRSQRRLDDVDGKPAFSLDLKINYEIVSLLLSFGAAICVLEPASLRERIVSVLQECLGNYGDG